MKQWSNADYIADLIEENFTYEDLQLDLIEGGHGSDSDAVAYYFTSSSTNDGKEIELQAVVSIDGYLVLGGRAHEMDGFNHIDVLYDESLVA